MRECAVMAHQDESGDKGLIGYFVEKGGMRRQEIGKKLKEMVGDYMVGSVLIEVDELAVRGNGKVEQKRLRR
ncbi:hypothetical protein, partial [Bacillus altitudinis]|uniref:hypothetical protein n=1 Tax=Bacillus altitudinis TaxID=293387 RepID=UPI00307FBF7C